MRIGFDAKRLYCNFTGLGNYSRTLVKQLSEHFPENEYFLYSPKIVENSETQFFLQHKSIKSFIPKLILKSYWRSYAIIKQLRKDKIDLYHGLSHELPFNIHQSNIKSIVTIHDLIFKVYPETFPAFDRKMYDKKFRFSCEHADRIIAISESTKLDIVKFYKINPDKIDVVYQSINPLYFEPSDDKEKPEFIKEKKLPKQYLLYVGSVEKRKNLKVIIEALNLLPKEDRIPLVVVGKGTKYKNEVLEKVQEYKLQNDVIWMDKLSDNKHLKFLYEEASIFLYPSVYEGFGLPVAEALLCKTPVITSNVSSLPEAAGPDSICIDPHDSKLLALSIKKILNDTGLQHIMSERGYEYANHNFNSKICTQNIHHVYSKILN